MMLVTGERSSHLTKNIRDELYPIMQEYDGMSSGRVTPFSVLSGPINYHSSSISTGAMGFRYSAFRDDTHSIDSFYGKDVNIILGGSTVFGVGSSNDSQTIASYLSKKTGEVWLNLGVRGAVSLQEYNHFVRVFSRFKKIKKVILFSGINDCYANFLKSKNHDFDVTFNSDNAHSNETLCFHSPKKIAFTYLMSLFPWVDFNQLVKLSAKDTIKSVIGLKASAQIQDTCAGNKFVLRKLEDSYNRNFLLYKALGEKLGFEFKFYFQPFANWTIKKFTEREMKIFESLDAIDVDNNLSKLDMTFGNEAFSLFKNICSCLNVPFVNANEVDFPGVDIFTDRVHLNDAGANLMADLILKT